MPPSADPEEVGGDRRRLIGLIAGAVVAALIVVLLVVGLLNRGTSTTIDDALETGSRPPAPALTLPVLVSGPGLPPVGRDASLSDLKGKVVVLNLWASWCEPCKEESPVLEKLWRANRSRGVVVLGVDIQDLSSDARAFIREYGLTYPSLRDGTDEAKSALEATGVPETYIIDRAGRIALHVAGPVSSPAQLQAPLDQVLAGK
jgi:cytochrome c biogenesis protein CcmG, thiol:disulfide interchange protein DsbE